MRFQPRIGHLLAAANENVVSLFDVETDKQIHSFQVMKTVGNGIFPVLTFNYGK